MSICIFVLATAFSTQELLVEKNLPVNTQQVVSQFDVAIEELKQLKYMLETQDDQSFPHSEFIKNTEEKIVHTERMRDVYIWHTSQTEGLVSEKVKFRISAVVIVCMIIVCIFVALRDDFCDIVKFAIYGKNSMKGKTYYASHK